eukprot:scaffold29533_cov166-Skeletonema_menzelii.AAC.2
MVSNASGLAWRGVERDSMKEVIIVSQHKYLAQDIVLDMAGRKLWRGRHDEFGVLSRKDSREIEYDIRRTKSLCICCYSLWHVLFILFETHCIVPYLLSHERKYK